MHVNKTNKFERNSSLEYYHMTCTGKKKTSQRGLFHFLCCISSVRPITRLGTFGTQDMENGKWETELGEREMNNGYKT